MKHSIRDNEVVAVRGGEMEFAKSKKKPFHADLRV